MNNIFENPNQETTEDKLLKFEKIQTPKELLSALAEKIHYGFVGKNDNKIYLPDEMDNDFPMDTEYFLQSPAQLINSGYGVCWDVAELERDWFSKHDYKFKVFFMMFAKDTENDLPTHTFLAFEDKGKWYWFEHAFAAHRGIHEYTSLETLIADVKNKQFDYAIKHSSATEDDYESLKVCEYGVPTYGLNPQEFIVEATRAL